jgi:hypothetical protein
MQFGSNISPAIVWTAKSSFGLANQRSQQSLAAPAVVATPLPAVITFMLKSRENGTVAYERQL